MSRLILLIFALTLFVPAYGSEKDDAGAAYSRGDFEQAMALSLPLAEAGDGDALGNIGNMYGFGWGVPVNFEKAIYYWQKAAEKHVPTSMGNMGSCYMTGKCGLPKDMNKAAEWYLKASEHRHAPSMITLSALYDLGMGIDKDKSRALAWAGLAITNAPNAKVKEAATVQLRQASRDATKDDMTEGQKLIYALIKIIDANVAIYKSGQ
jgi:TPR repeat protein